jgi:magnesium-transporting ATPase (P-type)
MTINEPIFIKIILTLFALSFISELCSLLLWLFSEDGKKNKAIEKAREACEIFALMCGTASLALFCWSVIFTIWRK